jgi:hypothetical protein
LSSRDPTGHDATAILQSAGLALDADEPPGRKQVDQRLRPLVPAKQIGRAAWHDGAVREERSIGRRFDVVGMPRDSLEQAAEYQVWTTRIAYEYARPINPRVSKVAVCRIIDRGSSSSGVTSKSSQP